MMHGLAARFFGLFALFALAAPACTAKSNPPGSNSEPSSPSGGAAGMASPPGGGQGGASGSDNPGSSSGGQGGGSPVVDAGPTDEPDAEPVDLPPPDPINVNACQHLQAGPFVPLMAHPTFPLPTDMAPAINSDAQAYRIEFPRRAEGFVTFAPATEGDYILYTSTDLPVAVFSLAGFLLDPVSLEIKAQECMEIKGKHIFHFTPAQHVVRLGAHTPNTVDIVVVPATPATSMP